MLQAVAPSTEMEVSRPWRRLLARVAAVLLTILVVGIIVFIVGLRVLFNAGGTTVGALQKEVTSKDGTAITYEQTGSGPVLILVSAALADRGVTSRLAKHLSAHFTVINYDRRGRGASGDAPSYEPEREVDDIQALIDANGGSALLFGSSSGAALALDAANRLSTKVKKVFIYEPPFIVDNSRPPIPESLSTDISELIAQGRSNDAVTLFFTKGMGIPRPGVILMRFLMPGWSKMTGMAHTLPYDLAVLAGTQSGRPLPEDRWANVSGQTLIAVGSRSESFFHDSAKAAVQVLPRSKYKSLQGMNHGSVLLSPKALASAAESFYSKPE